MLIAGSCHCSNISFALTWEPDPLEIRPETGVSARSDYRPIEAGHAAVPHAARDTAEQSPLELPHRRSPAPRARMPCGRIATARIMITYGHTAP